MDHNSNLWEEMSCKELSQEDAIAARSDEIKQLQSTVADLVERQDSLEAFSGYIQERLYEVEKEGRVSEFYLRNDMAQIKHMADSMAVKDPKNGKVWFAIGKVAGGIVRGLVPGL